MPQNEDGQLPPSNDVGFVSSFLNVLREAISKLQDDAYLTLAIFGVLGLAGLALILYYFARIEYLYYFLFFLIILAVALLIILIIRAQGSSSKDRKPVTGDTNMLGEKGKPNTRQEREQQIRELSGCLERLTEAEFITLQIRLLSPREQDHLSKPITRSTFLGDLERWNMLDRLKNELHNQWPDRFSNLVAD